MAVMEAFCFLRFGGAFGTLGTAAIMAPSQRATAERSEEIDIARAEDARRRAEADLANPRPAVDPAIMQAAMRRSMVRLRVAQRRHRQTPQQRSQ